MLITIFRIILASILLATASAHAGDFEPYSQARMDALQAQGRPVLIDVYADWCPTCERQAQILTGLLAQERFADYGRLKLDWDSQRDAARALGAPRQSTLFIFRAGKRLGLSVAETDEARLREFLELGLN